MTDISLEVTNLAITTLNDARNRATSHCDISCSEVKSARSTCNLLIRMLEFSVKNAHELLAMNADTNVTNIATDLEDIALLDGHVSAGEA